MKILRILLIISTISGFVKAQETNRPKMNKKGTFFAYWGWNRSNYTTSDIHFTGKEYNFELTDVVAKDRQSVFTFHNYFNPTSITIPQYNFRFGYFISDKYQISFGADHMKYVMQANQTVKINGEIANSGTEYDGIYADRDLVLSKDFLQFEHTDGLNYENIEVRRFDALFTRDKFVVSANEGFGIGILLPRTNATLLNNERYDEFHLAGYGFAAVASLNFTFFNYFFIQPEFKVGFINMPDIRTTKFKVDRADQYFWFSQYNVVFGGNFYLSSRSKRATKKMI